MMEISVGAKLLLDLGGTEARRIPGELTGWKVGKVLLASTPLLVGIRELLEVGRHVTCRYMHEGTVYGFKARILGYITNPESLVFLSYPDNFESLDLRKQKRLPCYFPSVFHCNGHEFRGMLNDISESGCRIECYSCEEDFLDNIILGHETTICFFPFGHSSRHHVRAAVVNASTDKNSITSIGFRFPQPSEACCKIIQEHAENVRKFSM